MMSLLVLNRHVIKFEFRTTEDNGLLVYGRARGGPEDILALKLAGGKLYYTVRCPSLSADLLFRHPMGKLSDGHWHSVAVSCCGSFIKAKYQCCFQ